eukprot:s581_g12.t1
MSILQDTFLWIERLSDAEQKPLPVKVKEELLGCALILPLCHSNIRWEVSKRVGASDASLSNGGRAAALVNQTTANTLYRLKWSKYSTAYRGRLVEGAQALNAFLSDHGYEWELIARGKSKVVDDILEKFVSQLSKSPAKGALRVAKHAVLYVQASRPRLRKSLQNTWSILRGWEEQQPSSFRPPIPLALLVVTLCEARQLAVTSQDHKRREVWYGFSALMMVVFFRASSSVRDLCHSGGRCLATEFTVVSRTFCCYPSLFTAERQTNGQTAIHGDQANRHYQLA